jgi:hypothetical protein
MCRTTCQAIDLRRFSLSRHHYVQTLTRLTTRLFDDIALDREKGCLAFIYLLVARIKFDQPEIGGLRDRAIDYRAVIATAAIEVRVELP